jgi:hypothetical protein
VSVVAAFAETRAEIAETNDKLREILAALRRRKRGPRPSPGESDDAGGYWVGRTVFLPFRETTPQYIAGGN